MTCRIGVDARAVGRWLMVELRPALCEHGSLGCVEVVNPDVQVNCIDDAGSGQVVG